MKVWSLTPRSVVRSLSVCTLITGLALGSHAGAACAIKAGFVGGDMKPAPGMTEVCGAKKQQIIDGLKAAYRKNGSTMPAYRWLEVYSVTSGNTGFINANGDMIWNNYTSDSKTQTKLSNFGYYANNYISKSTGRKMTYIFFTEPRNINWKTKYNVYIGW